MGAFGGSIGGGGGGAPSGSAGGDLGGTYPDPTVPGLAGKVATSRQITTAAPLAGGRDLSADVPLILIAGSIPWTLNVRPSSPHAQNCEFDSTTLPGNWTESGVTATDPMDPYATFSSGNVRRKFANQFNGSYRYLIQAPQSGAGVIPLRNNVGTLPTNYWTMARLGSSFNGKGTATGSDGKIGLAWYADSGGAPDTANLIRIAVSTPTANNFGVIAEKNVASVLTTIGTSPDISLHAIEYVALHKVGSNYYCWAFSSSGTGWYLGTTTLAFTPAWVCITLFNAASSANHPGAPIGWVKWIRIEETATPTALGG